MDNIEVIHSALERAHQHGFRLKEALTKDYTELDVTELNEETGYFVASVEGKSGKESLNLNLRLLLFDVTFARALFGDYWETHLNLMACSAKPLEYLQAYLLEPHQT